MFYGKNDLPLYVVKSTHIKQRVLSHFSADHRHNKEISLSQQLHRIEYIEKRALSAHADQSQLLTWANRGCKKFCVNRHFAGNCNFQKWNKNDYTIIIT